MFPYHCYQWEGSNCAKLPDLIGPSNNVGNLFVKFVLERMNFDRVSLFSVVENKDDGMYPLPLQHLPNQSLDRGRENGIYRCLPEYSEIICGLPRLFVIISSSSPPPPRAAGGEDELQDDAVGQAG